MNAKRLKMNKSIQSFRQEELKAIYRFIDSADWDELALIIGEIIVCHDNLMVFDRDTKTLKNVREVCINGESIQLNVEEWEDE